MIRASFSDRHPAGMITIACVVLLASAIFSYYQTTQWNPEIRFWKAAAVAKSEWIDSLRKRGEPNRFLRTRGAAVILIFLTVVLSPISNNDFIYFAF